MARETLATVTLVCSAEQKAALIGRGISHGELVRRLTQACQDATSREIARLTTAGPESAQGWTQRCNACRELRAEECARCADQVSADRASPSSDAPQ
jgi:hypothetical protein